MRDALEVAVQKFCQMPQREFERGVRFMSMVARVVERIEEKQIECASPVRLAADLVNDAMAQRRKSVFGVRIPRSLVRA